MGPPICAQTRVNCCAKQTQIERIIGAQTDAQLVTRKRMKEGHFLREGDVAAGLTGSAIGGSELRKGEHPF